MTACSAIAAGNGINTSRMPIRIIPPAMPNTPDRNDVATMVAAIAAMKSMENSVTASVLPTPSPPYPRSSLAESCAYCSPRANRVS